MKKNQFSSVLLPSFILPIGGLAALAICYLGYFAAYMTVESVFFPRNPTSVPAELIRISFAVLLFAIFWIVLRTKAPDLLKAIIFIGPLTMLLISAILGFYLTPLLALATTIAIVGFCILLLFKNKKSWIYYYATMLSVLFAMVYAWPRA